MQHSTNKINGLCVNLLKFGFTES